MVSACTKDHLHDDTCSSDTIAERCELSPGATGSTADQEKKSPQPTINPGQNISALTWSPHRLQSPAAMRYTPSITPDRHKNGLHFDTVMPSDSKER